MATEAESTAEWRQYWAEMETACRHILQYTRDMNEHAFYSDNKTFDAVIRNLELIYQAAYSLPDDIHSRLSKSDWRTIASFKDITANAQFGRNPMGLWETVDEQIPILLSELRAVHREAAEVKRNKRLRRRGRNASHPGQIPLLGWRDIGWRIYDNIVTNNLFIVSAGVGFYGLLAVFPALAALVSLYGLLYNPSDVTQQLAMLGGLLPAEAWNVIYSQLEAITLSNQTALSIGAIVGLLLTLWSARAGMGALLTSMNIVYKEEEKRSIIRFYLTALLMTLGAILFVILALVMIIALPPLLGYIGLREETEKLLNLLRWPLLGLAISFALMVLYRYGPSRNQPRWKWVVVGAVFATFLWISGSALFSYYVSNFGSYNETYGSVGAMVVLMLWFWLSGFIILLGAELNAEMEHQTKKDTTDGKPKPMGMRNAYMADTLGRRP